MITFGAKIPIAKCRIQNRETEKFENATIYEYTCDDAKDIAAIKRITANFDWIYGYDIYTNAWWKYAKDEEYNHNKFYAIENNHGKTIGLCETKENSDIIIEFLEAHESKKYRFVGQNILAALAKKALINRGKKLIIQDAQAGAMKFYRSDCGFIHEAKHDDSVDFIVNRHQLYKLIQQTENRTQGQIINLSL